MANPGVTSLVNANQPPLHSLSALGLSDNGVPSVPGLSTLAQSGTLLLPSLILYDSTGTFIESNNWSGDYYDSYLVFTAPTRNFHFCCQGLRFPVKSQYICIS